MKIDGLLDKFQFHKVQLKDTPGKLHALTIMRFNSIRYN